MKRIILAAIVAVASAAAGTASPLILDRDAAVELALENNADFLVSGIELETAARRDRNAWNAFLPNLSAGVSLNRSTETAWNSGASVSMSLPISAGLGYSIRQIAQDYEDARITYETARRELIALVEKEFAELLADEESIAIEQANLDLSRARYDESRQLYEAGLTSELTVLQARVSAANLEPTYLRTVADFESRVREFLIVLGLDPDTEISLEGNLESDVREFDAGRLIERYLSGRPDIRVLELAVEAARTEKSLSVTGTRTPSLGISAGWSLGIGNPFEAASWDSGTWSDSFSVGLSLSVPLDGFIPGSSDALTIAAADDEILKASIRLAQGIEEARAEILNLVAQLDTSAASMELSALNVELAERNSQLSEESYRRGIVDRLEAEDAQNAYFSAKRDYLVSQSAYLSALIDLRVALGIDDWGELD